MPSVNKRRRRATASTLAATNPETAAAPVREETTHPDENPYFDAFEAQLEAAKHALRAGRFISFEHVARVRSGTGHDMIGQHEIAAMKSAFLAAGHIAYGIRRRLDRGALIEDGPFCLSRDQLYRQAHDFDKEDPALWGNYSASADGAGIQVLEHVEDLGYDPTDASWWPILRGPDVGTESADAAAGRHSFLAASEPAASPIEAQTRYGRKPKAESAAELFERGYKLAHGKSPELSRRD